MHAIALYVITLIVRTDRFIFPCATCVLFYRVKTSANLINKTNASFMSFVCLSIARKINPRTKLVAKIKSTLSLIAIRLTTKLRV